MNELGSLLMVLSGATITFALLTAALGMSMRTQRNLVRSIVLELVDRGRPFGRKTLSGRLARIVISVWVPVQKKVLQYSGIRTRARALELSRQSFYVNCGAVSLAFLTLMTLMVQTDLTNTYVISNSSSDLPFFYRLTGAWAGSSGSLLFWYFLLTLCTAIVVYQVRDRLFNRQPALFLILGTLNFLFILLGLFFPDAQPFRVFPEPLVAGRGLNALLLHWAMIIHPPMLYLGYVSFAIPFAIAMSAVVSGNLHESWLKLIRRWSIFSWFFLGTGILLGSKWAYEELGWGGYWAWDPVENASLMPFLLATAFLHSLIVQERRGMLRFWNIILITLAYHFCLLGTWITRSGVLEGPHSFAASTIGKPFLIYILGSAFFFMRYMYFMRHRLKPLRRMESVTSREGSMLINNFIMALSTTVILIGVFSPLLRLDCSFDGGLVCNKVEWKESAYNKLLVPVGLLTLFLMGASPLLTWRNSVNKIYARNLRTPLIVGGIVGLLFGFLYRYLFTRPPGPDQSIWGPGFIAEFFSILTVGIAAFVITGLVQEFYRGIRSRSKRFGENSLLAFVRLTLRNKRRYGGYLIHLSIVFLFIGYAGGSFKKTEKFEFLYRLMPQTPGSTVVHYYSSDRAYMENYEIQARDLFLRAHFEPNADQSNPAHLTVSQEAHFHLQKGTAIRASENRPSKLTPYAFANREIPRLHRFLRFGLGIILDGRMKTERRFHPQINVREGGILRSQTQIAIRTPVSKPDIRSAWNEDIYIQLGSIMDPATGTNPEINHRFEFYYFQARNDILAYNQIFPRTIRATLEVWINPMVKFVWLGSILFFLSGLIILLPFGERDLDRGI